VRFSEDPLRLMRMIRLGPAQSRTIDAQTQHAARAAVPHLSTISVERIRDELEKILVAPGATAALRMMRALGMCELVLPEVVPTYDFEQNDFHVHDVWEHTLWVLDRSIPDLQLRLACLFHDTGKPHTLTVDDDGHRHFYKHELESERLCEQALERLK